MERIETNGLLKKMLGEQQYGKAPMEGLPSSFIDTRKINVLCRLSFRLVRSPQRLAFASANPPECGEARIPLKKDSRQAGVTECEDITYACPNNFALDRWILLFQSFPYSLRAVILY